MFFTRNKIFYIINIIIIFLISYIFGFDLCIIVATLGLSGVILGVFTLGLLGILVFITLMIIMSIACKRCKEKYTYCHSYENSTYYKMYLSIIMILF